MASATGRWSVARFMRHRWVRFLHRSRELLITLLFYLGLIAAPFGEPDLAVRYEVIKLHPPSSLMARENASSTAADSDDDERLRAILESASMMFIHLENTTRKTIADLEIHVRTTRSVAGVALNSNSSRIMREYEQLAQAQRLGEEMVTLPYLELVPPQSYVDVILWGDFSDGFGKRPLEVRASAESIDVERQKKSSGIALLVEDNANFLFMAFFALALVLLLRRLGTGTGVGDADG